MQVVILAAGAGTRMAPLSDAVPKPMLPVAGRPLLAHTVDAAIEAGASEVVLVVGDDAGPVRDYFADARGGVPVRYAVQETPAGMADAARTARHHLDGPFAVLNGDNLCDAAGLDRLFDEWPSVGTYRVDDPSNYGVLSVQDDRVTGVIEKPEDPPSDIANAGAYVFPAAARDWVDVPASRRGEHELTDVLARTIDRYDVTPVGFDRWLDVGRPWELLEANERLLPEVEPDVSGDVSPDAELSGSVRVEPGARIERGTVIEGPTIIESGARVGPNTYVRGASVVGPDVRIGHAVEVKNSVLMAGATVAHLSYVGDSILGPGVNLGAGTTVANLRHDDRPVYHTVRGRRVSTGRRKFGVVVGGGAKTGIDTSIHPGVTLSPGTTTRPGEVVDRDR